MQKNRSNIEEQLLVSQEITSAQLDEAKTLQKKTGEKLEDILVTLGYMTKQRKIELLAEGQGLEFVSLNSRTITLESISLIPYELCTKYALIPLEADAFHVWIAIADPLNLMALDDVRAVVDKEVVCLVAEESDIRTAIEKYYGKDGALKPRMRNAGTKSGAHDIEIMNALKADGEEISDDDAPVIKLVSQIILEAFDRRASDIHVEPLKDRVRVRYRIDGVLQEMSSHSKTLQGSVLSRLKIMAKLDIAEKRLPQDGRIKLKIKGRDVDVRVSTLPALYGESIVLRLLDREKLLLELSQLGFSEDDEKTFDQLINLPNGIMLVTGPTGSGKTTTLYTALNSINKPNRKIITVEDPVEYQLRGINQVQVKPNIGLTFAAGLRSILRQAPNVIMIGEIRDLETANIAIESSLTGHLVFSTLHTNDAAGAITRLVDMGVKAYLVASAVRAILAQRLVKKICPYCKEEVVPGKDAIAFLHLRQEDIKNVTFYHGRGCQECSGTGYLGRVGIFELLVLNDEVSELIYKKVSSSIIRERGRQCGMRTLREDAVSKVFRGITTLDEVIRVTQSDID